MVCGECDGSSRGGWLGSCVVSVRVAVVVGGGYSGGDGGPGRYRIGKKHGALRFKSSEAIEYLTQA